VRDVFYDACIHELSLAPETAWKTANLDEFGPEKKCSFLWTIKIADVYWLGLPKAFTPSLDGMDEA
jgi:hypothetical protein